MTAPKSLTKHLFYIYYMNISFSGDIQNLPGQGPVQPAVGDLASAGDWTR